jgi:hypothetical protein
MHPGLILIATVIVVRIAFAVYTRQRRQRNQAS